MNLPLGTDGMKDCSIRLYDDKGNSVGYPFSILKDTLPPTISFDREYDGTVTKSNSIEISGSVSNFKELLMNEVQVFPTTDGKFCATCTLHAGENHISFTATDDAGNSTVAEISITVPKSSVLHHLFPTTLLITFIVIVIFILVKNGTSSRVRDVFKPSDIRFHVRRLETSLRHACIGCRWSQSSFP